MALNPQQITQLAYNAGFRGSALRLAVAVAIAESSGNPHAYNPEIAAGTPQGSGSRGLWQIYGKAHPEFNTDALYDPQLNALAAYKVYREAGNSFRPWSTFNNGTAHQIAQSLKINTSSATLSQSAPLHLPALGGGVSQIGGKKINSSVVATQLAGAVSEKAPASGGVNFQLLPDNIVQALAAPDFTKTMLIGVIGFTLFLIGLIVLATQLAAPIAEPVAKVAIKAATSGLV